MTLLITGGTGTVGRPTVEALQRAGLAPRILSRRDGTTHDGTRHAIADLERGTGVTSALEGVTTLVHLATNRRSDARATRALVEAARSAGVEHLIYLSIVGVDKVPLGYYRSKCECEQLIASSGVPFTVLRATQFHEFIADFLRPQRRLPRVITLDVPVQPVSTTAVAARLVELVQASPAGGHADELGGPEVSPLSEFARQWLTARGASPDEARRRVVQWHAPGRLAAAYRAGLHTTGVPGPGIPFAEWAATAP